MKAERPEGSILYITLTDGNFQREVIENPQPFLVEFKIDWWGSCHIVAPIIEDIAAAYEGRLKVGRLDVEAHQEVAKAYGIRELPTLLFFNNGRVVNHIVGAFSRKDLVPKLEALLQGAIRIL